MCDYLHSHENIPALPKVYESGLQLYSDISFKFKLSICNVIPHELEQILCTTILQEQTEDDHGVEL